MKLRDTVRKLNGSRAVFCLLLALMTLFIFMCNQRSNLVADDYQYCFSFADGERISSVRQIFPSMAAHRFSMNGRIFPHFLVQLFLMLPLPVFRAVNALMFGALVLLICRIGCGKGEYSCVLSVTVFSSLWLLQSQFGQVFLWLDGAVNYLWSGVICLLFLLPYIEKLLCDREMSTVEIIVFLPFAFIVGGWSENATVGLVFMVMLFMMAVPLLLGKRLSGWMFLPAAALLAGFVIMMTAPAEFVNKSAQFSLPVLWNNFLETALMYLRFWPLLISLAAMYLLSMGKDTDRSRRILSLIFLGGSLASHFVLTFAMYCAGRSTFIALALLLCAWAVMFAELQKGGFPPVLGVFCAVMIGVSAYMVCVGFSDLSATHYSLSMNEDIITNAALNGERDVQLPRIYPRTGYCPMEGLNYLSTEDVNDWANVYMAKYYGVDSVIGY